MPSRTPSSSPEPHVKKRKHKHRTRSHSPAPSHSRSHAKTRHDHHGHRESRHQRDSDGENRDHKKDRRDEDYIPERLIKKEPEDGASRRPIKREQRDEDYDRRSHRDDNRHRQRMDRAREDDRRRQSKKNRGGGNPFRSNDFGTTSESEATETASAEVEEDKEKPNFGLSGKLTEETNTFRGVVIKYSEPAEARKPKRRWRLYPFKGEQPLPVLHIHRQSAYLLGRDRKVADIPVDHPSCSKQHAALQFRLVKFDRADGTEGHRVRPYIIDLGSTNGTYVNNKRIDSERYVELIEKDVVKFGFSTREYVLLHENASTAELEEDEGQESN